jgi:hypothetical protein
MWLFLKAALSSFTIANKGWMSVMGVLQVRECFLTSDRQYREHYRSFKQFQFSMT